MVAMNITDYNSRGIRLYCAVTVGVWVLLNCAGARSVVCVPGNSPKLSAEHQAELTIIVDISQRYQRIQSFGASDAWSAQYVGLWPEATRTRIAELLFSTDMDSGNNPVGIGLSGWRFYLGAGSSRDTDPDTRIRDRWRRADTFLDEAYDGYDWTRLPGQRWFLEQANAYGVQCLTLFTKSPPVNLTKNGLAYCDPDVGLSNLPAEHSGPFATYLADVLEYFSDHLTIDFDYISPFNEPQWDWENRSQEGCRYSNAKMAHVIDDLYQELADRNINTQILISEAAEIGFLHGRRSHPSGNQIDAFFDPESSLYRADKLAPIITGHSYFTDTPRRGLVAERRALKRKLDVYPRLAYAMTEYCIMGSDGSGVELRGSGRDLGMEAALRTARTIHHDLTLTDAVSWYWWLAVSPYNYKDGLVYIDKRTDGGNYHPSKMLWGVGNYSRFIRPGMYRVQLRRSDKKGPEDTMESLMVSAYYDQENGRVVAVAVNPAGIDKTFALRLVESGKSIIPISMIPYITSAEHDLAAGTALRGQGVIIPSKSGARLI